MKAHSVKCASCGKQHVPGFAYCQRCGAALGLALEPYSVSMQTAAPPVEAVDDRDESEFQTISSTAAREIAASGRKGCGTTVAALLLMSVIIFVAVHL